MAVPVILYDPSNDLNSFIELPGQTLMWQGENHRTCTVYSVIVITSHFQVDMFPKMLPLLRYMETAHLRSSLQPLLPPLAPYQPLTSSYSTCTTETICRSTS